MALKVIHICRDNVLGSSRHYSVWEGNEEITKPAARAWLWTECIMAVATRNKYRGCLVDCGNTPTSFEGWRKKMGYRKDKAKRIWKELFDRGLFEWREIDGKKYVHLFGFTRNNDRGRRKKDAPKRPSKDPPTTGEEPAKDHPKDTEEPTKGQRKDPPADTGQGVTGQNWEEPPIEERSVPKIPTGSTNTVPVKGDVPPVGGGPAPLPLEGQAQGEPNGRTERPPEPGVPAESAGPPRPTGPPGEHNERKTKRLREDESPANARGRGAGPPPTGGTSCDWKRAVDDIMAAIPDFAIPPRKLQTFIQARVARVEDVTQDTHSTFWFTKLLTVLSTTDAGRKQTRRVIDDFQSDLNQGRVPNNKGAALNARLIKLAMGMGIDVDALRTKRTQGAPTS